MNISVAMAVYNGEKFIKKQIDSILIQLKENDELIISYNESSDNTEAIVKEYINSDPRIKFYVCEKKGVLSNFENAIGNCHNEIIFLSDQDDIWVNNKVATVLEYFRDEKIGGIIHDCIFIDCYDKECKLQPKFQKNRKLYIPEILIKNPVQGSCLAFRKKFTNRLLPFPNTIPMHDSWIGMMLIHYSSLLFINEKLLLYRQHDNSVTKRHHASIKKMFFDKFNLLFAYFKRIYRV